MGGKGQSYIQPLGINGEGLFTLLGVMAKKEPENFQDVLELASVFNWLEKIEISQNINNEVEIKESTEYGNTDFRSIMEDGGKRHYSEEEFQRNGSTIQEVKNGEIADVDMDASNADDFDKDDMDGSFGSDGFDADDFDDLGDSDN